MSDEQKPATKKYIVMLGKPCASVPVGERHCQNGWSDFCLAGRRDGVTCPDDSCDIDDGVRKA